MCYTIPVGAAIITLVTKKKIKTKTPYLSWLNLLLWGGAIMLVVDHIWNGELLLVGENIIKDLLLGITMTVVVFVVWGIMVFIHKSKISLSKVIKTFNF